MRTEYRYLHSEVATWAEDFMDRYLRKPSFEEIRFLNTANVLEHAYITGNAQAAERAAGTAYDVRALPHDLTGYRVLRYRQQVDRVAELEGERGSYFVKYLGKQTVADETDMMFWMPGTLAG